ncbi:MAG: mprA [Acidobacteriales bacterium]|nr:mprA [Terriglobales bacterium]
MSSILIVEDEEHLANGLRFNLEAEGHKVLVAGDGESALKLLKAETSDVDAVVLDVMLPGISGFEVAADLRKSGQFVPILMLTARGRPEDVLHGFDAGADDYLPKPFELKILIARLHGLLRRGEWSRKGEHTARKSARPKTERTDSTIPETELFTFGGKTLDYAGLELRVNNEKYRLTVMEVQLLRYLVANADKVISRKQMLEDVWGLHEDTDTRAIDNFIARLRKYIEDEPAEPKHLVTVRGVGYRFIPEPAKTKK